MSVELKMQRAVAKVDELSIGAAALFLCLKTEKESSQNIAFTQYIVEIMEISKLYIVEICFAISCFLSIFVK